MTRKLIVFGSMVAMAMPVPAAAGSPASGREPAQSPAAAVQSSQQKTQFPGYRPPPGTVKPVRVVGAGARAPDRADLMITVLAPDHVAYTTKAQPTLYWFASRPIAEPVEIVVTMDERIDPVVRKRLDGGAAAGINQISLARLGAKLDPNRDYQWSVEVVLDPEQPSRNLVTKSRLRRIVPSADLTSRLKAASQEEQPAIYAENGIWHDALEGLNQLVAAQPYNPVWRQQRSALLEQGALPPAAAAAMDHGG